MEKVKVQIRKYLVENGAKRVKTGTAELNNGKNFFVLSNERGIEIPMRLADAKGEYQGRMSIIVLSHREQSDPINAEIVKKMPREINGVKCVDARVRQEKEKGKFGCICKYYLPGEFRWNDLDDKKMKRILGLYNEIVANLFTIGAYA